MEKAGSRSLRAGLTRHPETTPSGVWRISFLPVVHLFVTFVFGCLIDLSGPKTLSRAGGQCRQKLRCL